MSEFFEGFFSGAFMVEPWRVDLVICRERLLAETLCMLLGSECDFLPDFGGGLPETEEPSILSGLRWPYFLGVRRLGVGGPPFTPLEADGLLCPADGLLFWGVCPVFCGLSNLFCSLLSNISECETLFT